MIPTDLDRALVVPLSLPVGEADVAVVAELLVGKNRGERFMQAPTSTVPSDTLRLAVARVLAVGVLRFCLASGGSRARAVLRPDANGIGRRQRGRLWDASLNVDVDAAFSPMAFDLVWNLSTIVLPLAQKRAEQSVLVELSREERRILKKAVLAPAHTAFDHALCVLALENRNGLRLPDVVDDAVRRGLLAASPWCALMIADEPAGPGPAADVDVDALCAPGVIRLLEVADDVLAAAFLKRLRHLWSRSTDGKEFIARCQAFTRVLQTLLRALDESMRLDLLGPIARLVAGIPEALPKDARARLLLRPGVTTMADRDRTVVALQGICDLSLALDDVRARLQDERYGDDRYDEAQLTLRTLDDHLGPPQREAVAAFTRALSGAVG
ncbi:MAG: hypothetical protein Q8O67_07990 [Deltaproteobacteria bacterium]|nr:hypothetical protein [Deltaproteobacteria bacterium]